MLFPACFCVMVVASAVVAEYSFSAFCSHVALFSTSEACRTISWVWGVCLIVVSQSVVTDWSGCCSVIGCVWACVCGVVLSPQFITTCYVGCIGRELVHWGGSCSLQYWVILGWLVLVTYIGRGCINLVNGFVLKCTPGWSDLVLLFLIGVLLASVGYKLKVDLLVCLADLSCSSARLYA